MDTDGSDVMDDSGSQMIVSVESADVLELTVTKTNLNVFSELGKVWIQIDFIAPEKLH